MAVGGTFLFWNVNPVVNGVDVHSNSSVCSPTGVLSASGHLLRTKARTLKVSPAWKHFPPVEMLGSQPEQQSVSVVHNFWSL